MWSRGSPRGVLSILQVAQDLSNDFGFGDESNDAELASAVGTNERVGEVNERVGEVDASDQVSPSSSQCGAVLCRDGGVDLFWGRGFVFKSGQSKVGLGSIRSRLR